MSLYIEHFIFRIQQWWPRLYSSVILTVPSFEVIRIRKSKDRQHNDKMKNNLQNTTKKPRATRSPLKTRDERRCSLRVSRSCSTSGTRHVSLFYMLRHFSSTGIWSIYISPLIRYSRVCGCYRNFLDRGLLLTRKPAKNQRWTQVLFKGKQVVLH
jgi:hypothetical protein